MSHPKPDHAKKRVQTQVNWDLCGVASVKARLRNLCVRYNQQERSVAVMMNHIAKLEKDIRDSRPAVTQPAKRPNKPFRIRERYFT